MVPIPGAGRRTGTGRDGHLRALAVLSAAAAVVVVLGAMALRGGQRDEQGQVSSPAPGSSAVDRRALAATGTTAIAGDARWVFGGVSGPDGSAPPSTSWLPEGWEANDVVVAYGADGSVRRHIPLPDLGNRTMFGGQVVAHDDERFLVSSLCNGPPGVGCSHTVDPVLLRIEGDRATQVPLELPGAVGDGMFAGFLHVIGQTDDGTLWVSQDVTRSTMLPVTPVRLLALDLDTGRGVEVELPAGHFERGAFCASGDHIYGVQATLDDDGLTGLNVLRRPATTDPDTWDPVAQPAIDHARVSGVALECLPGAEIVLLLEAFPEPLVITFSTTTGSVVHEPVALPTWGAHLVGHLGQTSVLSTRTVEGDRQLMIHEPGGSWALAGELRPRTSRPVLVDGEVRDAQDAVRATRPDGVSLPVIVTARPR